MEVTGGFALAMLVDPAVVAPVLCQPSTPFAIGPTRSRDVNLSPADLDMIAEARTYLPVLLREIRRLRNQAGCDS